MRHAAEDLRSLGTLMMARVASPRQHADRGGEAEAEKVRTIGVDAVNSLTSISSIELLEAEQVSFFYSTYFGFFLFFLFFLTET